MLPSRIMVSAEQQRCDDIVCEEWQRLVREDTKSLRAAEVLSSRILNRIRRVE